MFPRLFMRSPAKLFSLAVILLVIGILVWQGPVISQQIPQVQMTMTPGIYPSFSQDISDYVINPGSNSTVRINVNAPSYCLVSIDGQPFRSYKFATQVLNVAAGQSFSVVLKTKYWGTKTYYFRRLPNDFPNWTTERPGIPQTEYYVFAPNIKTDFSNLRNYVVVADNYGVPLWWYRREIHPIDAKLLPNGQLGWLGFATNPSIGEARTLKGALTQTLATPPTLGGSIDNHELHLLPNGDYLYIVDRVRGPVNLSPYGGPANGSVLDNVIVEVAPNGKLIWQWSAFDHVPISETVQHWWSSYMTYAPADAYHMNSVDPDGDGYVLSMRHLDAIFRIDRATGKIVWKLGGTARPESLKMVGDTYGNFGGQHYARIMPDGTLTLHDNGTQQGRAPRGVRYSINPSARTATLLEQMQDAAAPFSGCCGSARKMPGGNWVMEWGDNPYVTELAPDGSLVFRMRFTDSWFSYRVDPVPFGKVKRDDLRQGMDAQYPR